MTTWRVHKGQLSTNLSGTCRSADGPVAVIAPRPVNLRADPFEQYMDAPAYPLYAGEKLWTVLPAPAIVQQHVASFTEFPPRQAPPGFNPKRWSKRCSRPPPSAKETSNGGRQVMIDDMLAGSSRR
jgi:hypothetical protein